MSSADIKEVRTKKDLADFINLPFRLYREDPLYVSPLIKELKEQFSDKNPFLKHAVVKYFIAKNSSGCIGRIASILNQRHIEFQSEKAGFFGFFECIDDHAVSAALLSAVSGELRRQGMEIIRGPMNFSTNEECGFLMEGFDTLPMLMTPYNPPYYNALMDGFGMSKAKDLYAFIYDVRDRLPEKVLRVAELADKRGIKVRPIKKNQFTTEMQAFKEVYNSAWVKNWGFIPLTDEELDYLGKRLRQIVVPELTLIAEKDGCPVGFLGLLPDFNHVLMHMKGRLNPLTILKALYYSTRIRNLRLLLLGIRTEYRNRGVDALLFKEGFKGILNGGYRQVEFSWVLEDNMPVQRIIEMIGGRLYKKYRIYEKML